MTTPISVHDREWHYNEKYNTWTSGWVCGDGDLVQLIIKKDESGFELQFLSGCTGSSCLYIDYLDFVSFAKKLSYDMNVFLTMSDYTTRCIYLADLFCFKFCEWLYSNNYKH